MIHPITMYGCDCDRCNSAWSEDHNGWCATTDETSLSEMLDSSDWKEIADKWYCPNCYELDEVTDEYVVRPTLIDKTK